MLPILAHRPGSPITDFRIGKFWPSELAGGIVRVNFDIQVFDAANLPRWIYAWQLQRSVSGLALPSSGLRMNFETGTQIDLQVTVAERSGKTRVFNASLPSHAQLVLATARQRTGSPPRLSDLRYVAESGSLYLADGSPRDFEALLLETS